MNKFMIFVVVVWGAWWYASKKVSYTNTMAYAQKHPQASWAPAVEYGVGLAYYQRADYPKAQETFAQLLTDFPTGQYTARALLRLSEVADENRDYTTEKETLDRFLADFPEHPDRAVAAKRRELLYNK